MRILYILSLDKSDEMEMLMKMISQLAARKMGGITESRCFPSISKCLDILAKEILIGTH